MIINLNQEVLVRLTPIGEARLTLIDDEINQTIAARAGRRPVSVVVDWRDQLQPDGRYRTQLWMLMRDFGPLMRHGLDNPFELDVEVRPGR